MGPKFLSVTMAVIAILAALIAAGLGGGYLWLITSLPRIEGSVTLAGLDSPVEVVRDANAVPHIYAKNQKDAYFALGYVHAQDRLWQMEFMRRLGAGRLAEVLGEPALATDRFIRTLGLYRLAEDIFESTSSEVRTVLEAYAEGVNAWMATRGGILPPEFILLRFEPEPWRPTDSLVWNRLMALRLGRNWNTELLRARIAQKGLNPELLSELWPEDPPSAPVTLARRSDAMGPMLDASWDSVETGLAADSGSNIWVVHGDRTKTGKPILANDPHLRFGAPVLWYLARIEAPGLTLTGVTVPGVPFIILGHNGSIAWGMTNGGADVQDLFVETLDPNDSKRYLTPKGPQPFITRQEVIRIKGGRTIQMIVRETHHGPVISDVSKGAAGAAGAQHVIALATPALLPDDRTVEAVFAINRARNWHEFYTATADFHTPHTNLVFAAVDGDIGFVSPGRIPVRKAGNGCIPIAGSDGRHDWIDFIPMEMRPQAHNPPSKRIVNANNRIVGDDYPYLMSCDWALPFRAERIVEVLDQQTKHGIIDSQELHRDILSIPARRLVPIMLRAKPVSERGREAMRLLSEWNFEMRRERPEPLLYAAWLRRFIGVLAGDEIGADLVADYLGLVYSPGPRFVEETLKHNRHWCDNIHSPRKETCEEQLSVALDQALEEIVATLGPDMDTWRWGTLHRATFTHKVFTNVPVIKWLADLSIESDGGDHTVNRGTTPREKSPNPFGHTDGSGFRAIYDLSDLDNSRFMIATGQSGNLLSPYYADFLSRWRDGEYIRITGSRDEFSRSGIGILQLLPAGQ